MNTTTQLPFAEFKKEDLGNLQTIRENTTRGEEVVKIELNKLFVRPGFNVRTQFGDITGLAKSIQENGQITAGRVDVMADGTFTIVEGERRFMALKFIEEDTGTAPLFKAIVNKQKTTEEERLLQMFTTQDNKPLTQVEVAELFRRLINLGYTQAKIADRTGKTPAYVSQMLQFASESPIIKEEVSKGNLSVQEALKLQKQIPVQSERVAVVKEAVEKKTQSGSQSQLKAKDISGIDPKQKKAESIADAIVLSFGIMVEDKLELTNLIKRLL